MATRGWHCQNQRAGGLRRSAIRSAALWAIWTLAGAGLFAEQTQPEALPAAEAPLSEAPSAETSSPAAPGLGKRWTRLEALSWDALPLEEAATLIERHGGPPAEFPVAGSARFPVSADLRGASAGDALEALAAAHGLKISWEGEMALFVAADAPIRDASPAGVRLGAAQLRETPWRAALEQLAAGTNLELRAAPELDNFQRTLSLDAAGGEKLADFLRALCRASGLEARFPGPATVEISRWNPDASRLDIASRGEPLVDKIREVARLGNVSLAFDPDALNGPARLDLRGATPLQAIRELLRQTAGQEAWTIGGGVIVIGPRRPAPGEGKRLKVMTFEEVPLDRVLDLFALKLDFDAVFDREPLRLPLTVDLRRIEAWEAFEIVLGDHGLAAERYGERLVAIFPRPAEPQRVPLNPEAQGRVDRIVFHQTPLQDAIRLLAEKRGLSVVMSSEAVQGQTVTFEFKDVTPEAALNSLLRVYGLTAEPLHPGAREIVVTPIRRKR